MAKVQMFGDFISSRLSAAAAEIFEYFLKSISEYEEQLCRSKEENEKQKKLLDALYNPEVRLHRADVQQLWEGSEEVPPEQQETNSSLNQEDPPEPPHTKEEQEELWTNQEGEQLQGPEDAHWNTLIFTSVPVKSEEDAGENPQFSQLHGTQTEENRDTEHFNTEAGGEDCGGSESGFQEHLEEQKESPSEELSFSCPLCSKKFSKEKSLSYHLIRHKRMNAFSCSVCKKSFPYKKEFETHMRIHTGEKPFCCFFCNKRFSDPSNLRSHLKTHTREKRPLKKKPTKAPARSMCGICNKWLSKDYLSEHQKIHAVERPFGCSVCSLRFFKESQLRAHKKHHTGKGSLKKRCRFCRKYFRRADFLKHQKIHTGEKPFHCSFCRLKFSDESQLLCHFESHKGEKPITKKKCPVCEKFVRTTYFHKHQRIHAKEKPFFCPVCDTKFPSESRLSRHMKDHSLEKPLE